MLLESLSGAAYKTLFRAVTETEPLLTFSVYAFKLSPSLATEPLMPYRRHEGCCSCVLYDRKIFSASPLHS